jgi:hypothetical protein
MTDIVERLKNRAAMVTPWATCCGEAAAELERLRAVLLEIAQGTNEKWAHDNAMRALETKP